MKAAGLFKVRVTFLLPPGIKGLIWDKNLESHIGLSVKKPFWVSPYHCSLRLQIMEPNLAPSVLQVKNVLAAVLARINNDQHLLSETGLSPLNQSCFWLVK